MQLPRPHPLDTLSTLGLERLRSLCKAISLDDRQPSRAFELLASAWEGQTIRRHPTWPSEVGDDNTPFEFSLALGPSPELRVMVEPLGRVPSLRSNTEASIALLEALAADYEIDVTRFNLVRDLFLPAAPRGTFAVWLAAEFSKSKPPQFKAYLNPFAQGSDLAPAVIEESFVRLGFPRAWAFIARVLARRGYDLDELMYVSLDLSPARGSRFKVYARHRRSTVADLEVAASASPAHKPGDVTRFLATVAPGLERFDGRAPFTCYAFVEDSGDQPAAVTTHFPINGYASNDEVVQARVSEYLAQVGIPQHDYRSALAAFAPRPLSHGIGLQSYVSIRRHHGRPRLTVYLPVEAYQPGTVAKAPCTVPPSGVTESVQRLGQTAVETDPFIRRLRREPPDSRRLHRVIANHELFASVGLMHSARAVAPRIAKLELRQFVLDRLADGASGGGANFDSNCTSAFPGIIPISTSEHVALEDPTLLPARRFGSGIENLYGSDDAAEALGTLVACKLFDEQFVRILDEQLRRCDRTDNSRLPAHRRRLAETRGEDSRELARRMPEESLESAWRGARAFWRAAHVFLSELYTLCYCESAPG